MAGKSMKPGGGGRFAKMKAKLSKRPGVSDPAALAAAIGREKYGGKKMAAFSEKGKERAAHNTRIDFGNAGEGGDLGDQQSGGSLPPEEVAEHNRRTPHPNAPEYPAPHLAGSNERMQSTEALDGLIKSHLAQMKSAEAKGAMGRAEADHHRDMIRGLRENHPMYAPKAHRGPTFP